MVVVVNNIELYILLYISYIKNIANTTINTYNYTTKNALIISIRLD